MAKILLNEGTEIEVSQTRLEIKNLIYEEDRKEKELNLIKNNFIEVTMIKEEFIKTGEKEMEMTSSGRTMPEDIGFYKQLNIKIDLYYKRILFIYD